jgi:hypothetical protein
MKSLKLSQQLESIVNQQISDFNKIPADTWEVKPLPHKWSKKEILGHLIDSAINNVHRFVRIQYEDKTNIYYDQDFWVSVGDYQNQEVNSIINLWQLINLHITRIWKNINDDQLSKTIPVMDKNPTLEFLMEDYIDHLHHHLKQIML